jgi:hypothetical protein
VDTGTIAAAHGLTERSVERLVDELRAANILARESNPVVGLQIVERMVEQFEHVIGEIADIQQKALDAGNLPVALGAVKAKSAARMDWLKLLQARGLVPKNLGLLEAQVEGVALVSRIMAVFEEYGIGHEVAERVAAVIDLEIREQGGHLQLVSGGEVVDAVAVG